jgi:probable phosphoglycerate mutase
MTTTRFCLVRHGETDWNAERRLQGYTDIPLNAHGLAQAAQMAKALKKAHFQFDALYTSDLQRAKQTAQAIEDLYAVSATSHNLLRERHLGALQGLTTSEAPLLEPELWQAHLSRDIHQELRGGESILQFANRIKAVLQEIQEKYTGKTILIVSHGGALDMMYRIASNQALDAERAITVPNASLNWISCDGPNWKVDNWADTSHLDGLTLGNLEL